MKEEQNDRLESLKKSGVHFLPWIGEKYEDGIYYDEDGEMHYGDASKKGKKILVLGESFYMDETDFKAYTGGKDFSQVMCDIIKDYIKPENEEEWKENWEPYKNTYTKFERAMAGKVLKPGEEKKEFWQHVMFYNYVQDPLTGPRIMPSRSGFKGSEKAFFCAS